MTKRLAKLLAGLSITLLSVALAGPPAFAQLVTELVPIVDEPSASAGAPRLMHSAPSDAQPDEILPLTALLSGAWDTQDIYVAYRRLDEEGGRSAWHRLELRRQSTGGYRARIPAGDVAYPGVEYYIASSAPDGSERVHFASPDAPHRVVVLRDSAEQRYQRRLGHHRGRVHSAKAEAWGAWFGSREKTRNGQYAYFDDYLWNVEGSYTYRFLGIVYSMTFGAGSLRGVGEEWGYRKLYGERPSKPGIDYGFSAIRFAVVDWLLLTAQVRLGADERGFVGGVGGFATVGRPAGTHLDLGADWTYGVGYRTWLEFAWDTVPYCVMSLRGEITNWPDEAHTGTIATFNTAIRVHPLAAVKLSIGFAGRHGEAEAGVVGGLGTEFYF